MRLINFDLEIFFIRHGEAVSRRGHWIEPNAPLTNRGVKQVQKTAKMIKNLKFNAILSSPLLRARQTAEIIIENNISPMSFIESSWLSEIDLGKWAGKSKQDCIKTVPNSLKFYLQENYNNRGPLVGLLLKFQKEFKFPFGESLIQFWNRVSTGFLDTISILNDQKKQKIALIGHGGSFTIALLVLLRASYEDIEFPVFVIGLGDLLIVKINYGQILFYHLNSNYDYNHNYR